MKIDKDFNGKTGGVFLANLQASKNPILLRMKVLEQVERACFDLWLILLYHQVLIKQSSIASFMLTINYLIWHQPSMIGIFQEHAFFPLLKAFP